MNFNFDCILLKNNKAVMENVELSINDISTNFKSTLNYFNNCLKWLIDNTSNKFKNIIIDKPLKNVLYWSNIYPNYFDDTINLHQINNVYLDKEFSFEASISFKTKKLLEKHNEIKDFRSLDQDILNSIVIDIYSSIKYFLNNNRDKLIERIKNELYYKLEKKEDIIFIAHCFNGYQTYKFEKFDVQFVWCTNYGYGYSTYSHCFIDFLKENLIIIGDNPNYVDLKRKEFSSPFEDNFIIREINELLLNPGDYKLLFAKNQIRILKNALKLETKFLEKLELEILPNLKIELKKIEELKILYESNNELYDFYSKEYDKITKDINLYKSEEKLYSITSDAISTFQKKEKINLIKAKINFWINWIESEENLMRKV
jgi:hypothetical protein